MKWIKSSVEIVPQEFGMINGYKHIEKVSRNCYSKDTEILTENGFINVQEISPDDLVLTYNKNSNQLEYQKSNMIKKWYSGKMITVNHANINFCVTPDHRMFVSKVSERNYDFLEAKYLYRIKGSRQCRFRIPKYFLNSSINNKEYSEELSYTKSVNCGFLGHKDKTVKYIINDDFLILVGAYITEGHSVHREKYGSGSYLCITQSEHNSLYTDVIEALTNLNIKFRVASDPRKPEIKWILWGNSVDVEAFDTWFGRYAKNKHLPDWFKKLSARQLDLLLTTMYKGDGSHNTTRNERYLSISPVLLNQVQEIWILLGKNALTKYDSENSDKCYTEQNLRDSWIISKDQLREVEYNDYVYCPSTDNGVVCIRYNGKTMWCGNCYRSEDRITEDSYKKMLDLLMTRKHYSPLEHFIIYLTISTNDAILDYLDLTNKYKKNKFSRMVVETSGYRTTAYITTNFRVIVENEWQDDLKYMTEPSKHILGVTAKVNCSIGVSREWNRHRISVAEQSTRYCNYSKDKFGSELTYIVPEWIYRVREKYSETTNSLTGKNRLYLYDLNENSLIRTLSYIDKTVARYIEGLKRDEEDYMYFLSTSEGEKLTPQEARGRLPLDLATSVYYTAYMDQWNHFFDLRCANNAHPDIRVLATDLKTKFKENNLI